jgi:hypothetical protein
MNLGINIVIGRQTTSSNGENCSDNNNSRKKNTSTIRIEKVSPLPPPSQNQAQKHSENGEGIMTNEGSTSLSRHTQA